MAIARDNSLIVTGSGTSLSSAFTVSGANTILFVITSSAGANPATAVTYNGVSLTQIGTNVTPNACANFWYLLNPATGSHTLSATGYANSGIGLVGQSYTGVNQGSPINVTNQTSGSGTSFTISATTTADNCWGIMLGASGGGSAISASTNANLIQSQINGDSSIALFDTNSAQTPAGSKSMAFTGPNASKNAIVAFFSPLPPPIIYTLTCNPASFTFTGKDMIGNRILRMVCLPTNYTLTMLSAMYDRWTHAVKHIATWINENKSNM
jgi:hypothetical protein